MTSHSCAFYTWCCLSRFLHRHVKNIKKTAVMKISFDLFASTNTFQRLPGSVQPCPRWPIAWYASPPELFAGEFKPYSVMVWFVETWVLKFPCTYMQFSSSEQGVVPFEELFFGWFGQWWNPWSWTLGPCQIPTAGGIIANVKKLLKMSPRSFLHLQLAANFTRWGFRKNQD